MDRKAAADKAAAGLRRSHGPVGAHAQMGAGMGHASDGLAQHRIPQRRHFQDAEEMAQI